MKINKFKVTTVLYFKSGNSKKVDWFEERLVKKIKSDEKEVTEGLTLDEADAFFQGKFKEWKDNSSTIVRKNIKGYNSIIPFGEVEYVTVEVTLVGEDVTTPTGEKNWGESEVLPFPPPPPQGPPLRTIGEHPAFKK